MPPEIQTARPEMGRNCDAFGSLKSVDTTYYSNACKLAGPEHFDGAPVDHVTQYKSLDPQSSTDHFRPGRVARRLRFEPVFEGRRRPESYSTNK